MTSVFTGKPTIIRTERGLTISGTRITPYDVMDYVTAQYPPKFIRALFNLTDEQIDVALTYIEANRPEFEAEYQLVLKEAEELRQYYEEQNRELIARLPPSRLNQAWKLLGKSFKHRKPDIKLNVSPTIRLARLPEQSVCPTKFEQIERLVLF